MTWLQFNDKELDLLESALTHEITNIGKAIDVLKSNDMGDSVAVVAGKQADLTTLLNWIRNNRVIDDADPHRKAARGRASDDLEVDEDAIVSAGGDPGAWVHAWIWISDEKAGLFTCAECSGVFTLDHRHCSVDQICDECAAKEDDEDVCSECGEPLDEAGDGYDGKCPNCADQAEQGSDE